MDKFFEVIRNKWFRLGVSLLTFLYAFFIGYVSWLSFAFYLKPTNDASLFVLYLFINFLFGAEMYFTRKTIITKVLAVIIPLECFVLLLTSFGNWFIIIPPVVISIVCFFLTTLPESAKTIMGTLYLIMFVVGTLAYMTFVNFGITIFYVLTDNEINLSQRNEDSYLLSTDGSYRLVSYTNKTESHTTTSYYIEIAKEDQHVMFLDCYKVYGCEKILATIDERNVNASWVSDTKLRIDGKVRDVEELFVDEEENATQTDENGLSVAETTTAAKTTKAEETVEETTEDAE